MNRIRFSSQYATLCTVDPEHNQSFPSIMEILKTGLILCLCAHLTAQVFVVRIQTQNRETFYVSV